MRGFLRWLPAGLLTLLVLIAAALWQAGGSQAVFSWGLNLANEAFQDMGLELKVEEVSGNVLGRMRFKGVALGSQTQGWWTIEEMEFIHYPWTLLWKTLTLKNLTITRPNLPVMLEFGTPEPAAAAAADAAAADAADAADPMPFDLKAVNLKISGGHMQLLVPWLNDLDLEADYRLNRDLSMTADLRRLDSRLTQAGLDLPVSVTGRASLALADLSMTMDGLSLKAGNSQLNLSGEIIPDYLLALAAGAGLALAAESPARPAKQSSRLILDGQWADPELARLWGGLEPDLAWPLHVRLEGRLEGKTLALEDLRLAVNRNYARLLGQVQIEQLSALLRQAGLLDLKPGRPAEPDGPGQAASSLDLECVLADPELLAAHGLAQYSRLPLPLVLQAQTEFSAGEAKGQLNLSSLASKDLTLQAQTLWRARPDQLQARLNFSGLDAGAIAGASWSALLQGKITAVLEEPLSRQLQGRADIDLTFSELLEGLGDSVLRSSLVFAPDRVQTDDLSLRGAWGQADLQARLQWDLNTPRPDFSPPLQVDLNWREVVLPPALADQYLPDWLDRPYGQGSLSARGSLDAGALDLHLTPKLPPRHLADVRIRGGWQSQDLFISQVKVNSPNFIFNMNGRADQHKADLTFNLHMPQLQDWRPWLREIMQDEPPALAGSLDLSGMLAGTWHKPALQLKAALAQLELDALQTRQINLDLDLSDISFAANPQGHVRLTVGPGFWDDMDFKGLDLEASFAEASSIMALRLDSALAQLGLQANGDGTLNPYQKITVSNMSLSPRRGQAWHQEGQALLQIKPQEIRASDFLLTRGQRQAAFALLMTPRALSGKLSIDNLSPSQWLPEGAFSQIISRRTRFDLLLELGGTPQIPVVALKAGLYNLDTPHQPLTRIDIKGGYYHNLLALEASGRTAQEETLTFNLNLKADLSLDPFAFSWEHEGLRGRLRAKDMPLAILTPLTAPDVGDWSGNLNTNLSIRGDLPYPELRGRIELDGGGFVLNSTAQTISNLEAQIDFAGHQIRFTRFAYEDQGRLNLNGTIDLPKAQDQPGSMDLRLTAEGLPISLGVMGEIFTDMDIKAAGPFRSFNLSGSISPVKVDLNIHKTTTSDLDDIVLLKTGETPPELTLPQMAGSEIYAPDFLAETVWDVELNLRDDLRVEIDEGWAQLRGRVKASKAASQPVVFDGRIRATRGVLVFFGKRITLNNSSAGYDQQTDPVPSLDLKAALREGGSDITIAVKGPANDPSIHMSSDPPMSQSDILSTIIYGRPMNQLSASESSGMSAQAMAFLGWQGAQQMSKIIGSTLTPDVVTVHNDSTSGSSIEAGKYITADLYLRYRNNMEEQGGSNVGFEYRFNRFVFLEGQVGTTHDTGADLMFNYDFDFLRQDPPRRWRSDDEGFLGVIKRILTPR